MVGKTLHIHGPFLFLKDPYKMKHHQRSIWLGRSKDIFSSLCPKWIYRLKYIYYMYMELPLQWKIIWCFYNWNLDVTFRDVLLVIQNIWVRSKSSESLSSMKKWVFNKFCCIGWELWPTFPFFPSMHGKILDTNIIPNGPCWWSRKKWC